MTEKFIQFDGDDIKYRLEGDDLIFTGFDSENPPKVVTLDEFGAPPGPAGESVLVAASEVFDQSLFDDLTPGAVTVLDDGSIEVDPTLLPVENTVVWGSPPPRPYLVPGALGRQALTIDVLMQWPEDGFAGTGIDAGVGVLVGFGSESEGEPQYFGEAGIIRHSSNSSYLSLYTGASGSAFADQFNRYISASIAADRFGWGSIRAGQYHASQAIDFDTRITELIDDGVLLAAVQLAKGVTAPAAFTWMNDDLDGAQWFLRLQGDPDWPYGPIRVHSFSVR
jgi:hypothetical protein